MCDYEAEYVSHLKEHNLAKHMEVKLYKCDKCDFKAAQQNQLEQHIKSHKKESVFIVYVG